MQALLMTPMFCVVLFLLSQTTLSGGIINGNSNGNNGTFVYGKKS